MATEVIVLIPWHGGCPWRERALAQVSRWYSLNFPRWRVSVVNGRGPGWCKASAVMPAVAKLDEPIVVVADADVTCEGLADAVAAVRCGAAWAVPHDRVVRLAESGTDHAEHPYSPMIGGGMVVARREVILSCPLDKRFVGWGRSRPGGRVLGPRASLPLRQPVARPRRPDPHLAPAAAAQVAGGRLRRQLGAQTPLPQSPQRPAGDARTTSGGVVMAKRHGGKRSHGFASKKQWRLFFANPRLRRYARKKAHQTPGGKGVRYRRLPLRKGAPRGRSAR